MQNTRFSLGTTSAYTEIDALSRRDFLKLLLAGMVAVPLASCGSKENNPITPQPNVVVIFADDIGPGDIGFYHQQRTGQPPVIPTPNIDQMISNGMRFDDAHAPNSLCAPSRFSMLTGNYSFRNEKPFGAWRPWNNPGIEPKYTTSARIAKQAGYATSFLGKWGCGGQLKEQNTGAAITKKNLGNADFTQLYKSANYFGFDYALELPVGECCIIPAILHLIPVIGFFFARMCQDGSPPRSFFFIPL